MWCIGKSERCKGVRNDPCVCGKVPFVNSPPVFVRTRTSLDFHTEHYDDDKFYESNLFTDSCSRYETWIQMELWWIPLWQNKEFSNKKTLSSCIMGGVGSRAFWASNQDTIHLSVSIRSDFYHCQNFCYGVVFWLRSWSFSWEWKHNVIHQSCDHLHSLNILGFVWAGCKTSGRWFLQEKTETRSAQTQKQHKTSRGIIGNDLYYNKCSRIKQGR